MTQLTTRDVAMIRELRYVDGLTCEATARLIGCHPLTVGRLAPGRPGKVPNDKAREAVLASGLTVAEVARRMGWTCRVGNGCICPDSSRLKRTLGLLPTLGCKRPDGSRSSNTRQLIDAETAGLIAEALGLSAWEVMPDDP